VGFAEASAAGRIGDLLSHSWLVQSMAGVLFTALAGMAVTFVMQYRRLTWRAYLNAPIDLVPAELRNMAARLVWEIFVMDADGDLVEGTRVDDPSLVVLRIRNAGIVHIEGKDFVTPLEFSFPGRTIEAAEVTEAKGQSAEKILPPENERKACGTSNLELGAFSINRRDRFTVLVVLSGRGESVELKDHDGRPHGYLKGGEVQAEKPRRGPITGTRLLLVTGTALVFAVFALIQLLVLLPTPQPSSCIGGQLLLEGSTAFAPAAQQIAGAYTAGCHAAHITVGGSGAITGTVSGLNALAAAGQQDPAAAATQIAMSDGQVPAGYPGLVGQPVGVVVFTVVTNRQTGVFKLSTAQIRAIFSGSITNWRQLGGADLPVSIVSRYLGSGTRETFDRTVLGGSEPPASSYDCVHKNVIPSSPVILCDEPNTGTLLQYVARIPGAIGFAETGDVAKYPTDSVQAVQIDGLSADIGLVGTGPGQYHFWTVEYLYTYGTPKPGSLAAAYIGYTGSYPAKDILRSDGYIPCTGPGSEYALCLAR
jgi:phosphate transport system substrate-binding protein